MKKVLLVVISLLLLFAACSQPELITDTEYDEPAAQGGKPASVSATIKPALTVTPSATSATPSPSATPTPEPIRATVIAAGDLMCLYGQIFSARKKGKYDFNYCFDEIKEKVSAADVAIGNLETLVAKGHKLAEPYYGTGNPKLNAPEEFLSALAYCGFDVLINANNHIYDYKKDGVEKTISNIEEYGLLHTGAYASGQKKVPLIIYVKGIKIAVFGYAVNINGQPSGATMVDKFSEKLVSADMKAAKEVGADFILVYMHWGTEDTHKATSAQKKQAKFVASAGADIIIGSHPHCVQGVSTVKTERGNVPVFYSLGNLISSATKSTKRDSALVNIELIKDYVTGETVIASITYTPTFCMSTDAGRNVILPADLKSISQSVHAKALKSSRKRTVRVIGDAIAQPM